MQATGDSDTFGPVHSWGSRDHGRTWSQPDEVALMGNLHITPVSKNESWVTVGEWLPRKDTRGNLLLARLRWPSD